MTLRLKRLDSVDPGFHEKLGDLLAHATDAEHAVIDVVKSIIAAVRARGDAALIEYTNRFDRRSVLAADELVLDRENLEQACAGVDPAVKIALERAAERIRAYHEHQRQQSWSYVDAGGTLLGQQVTPLDRVGVYVPGGKAAYPSSVLMNVLPAKVAGVGEVLMVVPAPDGKLEPIVLAAAAIADVDRVYTIGGAQAIAALAYGTSTIPRVDKIVGPGNIYVATAKSMVYGAVGIDMIAGPSEIVVVCDGATPADWIAMDLFSQAEHDESAQSILISPDAAFLDAVAESMERLLPGMERAAIIRKSLEQRGAFIRVVDLDEAAAVVNRIAPEHLELSIAEPQMLAQKIRHAGAIFMGRFTAEALGDYCAGPNHVLPTAGTARFSSPLGVYDFQKRSSLIMSTATSTLELANIASVLARGEGLTAHACSAELRLQGDPEV